MDPQKLSILFDFGAVFVFGIAVGLWLASFVINGGTSRINNETALVNRKTAEIERRLAKLEKRKEK